MPSPFEADDVVDDDVPVKKPKVVDDDSSDDVVIEDEEPPSRSEKRRARGEDRWNERERQLEAANARNAENAARIARLESQVEQSNRRDEGPDPLDKEYDDVWEKRRQLAENYRSMDPKTLTPERQKQFMEEAKALEKKQYEVAVAKEARKYVQPREDPQVAALRVKHHDVVSDETRFAAAQLYFNKKKKERGLPNGSSELVEEAMNYARKFSLDGDAPRAKATDADRARHTGAPRGGGGRGNDGAQVVRMTKDDKKMADSMLSHIKDEKKRYQHFAKNVLLSKDSTDDA